MKKCVIENYGEGYHRIYEEFTDEQFNFLNNLFNEINHSPYSESYAPWISIWEAKGNELKMFENNDN